MRRMIYLIATLNILLSFLGASAYAIDAASLVKVGKDNDTQCVEYYTYKDELYCSTKTQSSTPVDPNITQYEKLKIIFDDRPWQLAWGKQTPEVITVEYIPNGEDIDHWNELITSQVFPGLQKKVTPKQFADLFIQRLKKLGYEPIVTFHEDTKNQVIFEFRIEQPENQIQDELQMVTKDKNNLYVLHYAIKKADMGKENRDKWVQNLKNSTIKK